MTTRQIGIESVLRVAALLRSRRHAVHEMPSSATPALRSPYDLLVDYLRVEVKTSPRRAAGNWSFSLGQPGDDAQSFVDFYVFELQNVPDGRGYVYLVMPASLCVNAVNASMKSLKEQHARHVNNFEILGGRTIRKLTESELKQRNDRVEHLRHTQSGQVIPEKAYEFITPTYIRELRNKLLLTQYEFSNLLNVRRETVIRWEKPNGTKPQASYGRKLVELAITADMIHA